MIVGNIANHELKLGFESDFNKVTIFTKERVIEIPEAKKSEIAIKILNIVAEEFASKISLVNKNVK
jgi:hypothetical protein